MKAIIKSKMSLECLPLEILMIICSYLDTKSKMNFFEAGSFARDVISSRGVVKHLHISMNSLATVKTLKTDFFRAVAGHLVDINMCGVVDLCKTALLPAMRHMKCLKSIDITFTNIDYEDFLELYAVCPTITKIGVNFRFDKPPSQKPDVLIKKSQEILKNMDFVHFVGTATDLMYSVAAQHMLQKADLNELVFTVLEKKPKYPFVYNKKLKDILKFKEFNVYCMNLDMGYGTLCHTGAFQDIIKLDIFEYIVICCNRVFSDKTAVYVTPLFQNFFKNKFGFKAKCYSEFQIDINDNMVIMMFNRDKIRFDDTFYAKLFNKIKLLFPTYFFPYTQTPVASHLDWFQTSPAVPPELKNSVIPDCVFKKKRIANPNFVLDFDAAFKTKSKVMLSLTFNVNYVNPVSLMWNSDFLPKLTFLSLSGTVKYSIDFFNVLFRSCINLETLDIVAPSISPCAAPISRSLPLSKSLKNIRLIDRRFDYKTFFNALSQCKTLQNIHLLDLSSENTPLADPSMVFKNCENLYNFCITTCMSNIAKAKITAVFNNAKMAMGRPQVCQILLSHDRDRYNYDPYIGVFNVYPIRPRLAQE